MYFYISNATICCRVLFPFILCPCPSRGPFATCSSVALSYVATPLVMIAALLEKISFVHDRHVLVLLGILLDTSAAISAV